MSSPKRPRRLGYAIGRVLVAIGALVAISALLVFLVQVTGRLPTDDHSFANNQSTTAHMDAGEFKSIYYTSPASGTPSNPIGCSVRDPQARRIDATQYDFGFIPTSVWQGEFYFEAKDAGDYTVSCSGPSDIRYGVGEYVDVDEFTALIWAIVVGVVLVIAGFAAFVLSTFSGPEPPPTPAPTDDWE
jgi:hypothetical protein